MTGTEVDCSTYLNLIFALFFFSAEAAAPLVEAPLVVLAAAALLSPRSRIRTICKM